MVDFVSKLSTLVDQFPSVIEDYPIDNGRLQFYRYYSMDLRDLQAEIKRKHVLN